MKIRETVSRFASNIQSWSKVKIAAVSGVLLAGTYVLVFVVPRTVEFSYGNGACVSRLVVLPDTLQADSDIFDVTFHGGFSVGGTRIVSTQLCFIAKSIPKEGTAAVSISPWGSVVFRAQYNIHIEAAPTVMAAIPTAQIAITKPVLYTIDKTDRILDYTLSSNKRTSDCSVTGTTIACDLRSLELKQGASHTITLARNFKDSTEEITSTTVHILPAVSVTRTSPTNNQTIYGIPEILRITTDKKLLRASATLEQVDNGRKTLLSTTVTTDGASVLVSLDNTLKRTASFRLTLNSAEAEDGSTIVEPYVLHFKTSGGPQVKTISVGDVGVDTNARIVVSFDQPIASSVNIAKLSRTVGVDSTRYISGNTVIFALKSSPRCTAFTIQLDKGIKSGVNNLLSEKTWSYTSRTSCRKAVTIGYSVNGRPITAYYYGTGSTSVLFTGGIHGSEPSSTTTMQAWISYLDSYAYTLPSNRQVVIVPNVNPDGIATGNRYNANNVNLARNFPTADWSKDIETAAGIVKDGGGTKPLSEPETRALASLTSTLKPRLEISFHAKGSLVGANDYGSSRDAARLYAATVGYATMFGSGAEDVMGYGFTGEYEDWIREKLGKPAILIELPTHSGNYFTSQRTALIKMVRF